VGIGENQFPNMDRLDGDHIAKDRNGEKSRRDIVQFIPFKQYSAYSTTNTTGNKAGSFLAKKVLEEVPLQLISFMRGKGFRPRPPGFIVPGNPMMGQQPFPGGQTLPYAGAGQHLSMSLNPALGGMPNTLGGMGGLPNSQMGGLPNPQMGGMTNTQGLPYSSPLGGMTPHVPSPYQHSGEFYQTYGAQAPSPLNNYGTNTSMAQPYPPYGAQQQQQVPYMSGTIGGITPYNTTPGANMSLQNPYAASMEMARYPPQSAAYSSGYGGGGGYPPQPYPPNASTAINDLRFSQQYNRNF